MPGVGAKRNRERHIPWRNSPPNNGESMTARGCLADDVRYFVGGEWRAGIVVCTRGADGEWRISLFDSDQIFRR